MTFTSPQDRARAAAPTSSLMQTPAHLEALVTRDLKPIAWDEKVDQVKKLTLMVNERKRREKLAKVERLMNAKPGVDAEPPREDYLFHPFRMKRLISVFCRVADIKHKCIFSKSKTRPLVTSRHILMWILHKNTGQSLSAIGRTLGDRDHTTILHGIRKISNRPDLLKQAREIEKAVLFFEHETYSQTEGVAQ